MQSSSAGPARVSGFITFVTILLVVAILRFAAEVIIPLSLSVLLAFLLAPLVNRLVRWGLHDTLAITVVATLSFGVLAGMTWTVATQAVDVLEELPRYEQNIRTKITSLKSLAAPGSLSRTKGMVETLKKEVSEATPTDPPLSAAGDKSRPPVAVTLAEDDATPLETIQMLVTPVLGPLGTGGIVVIFVLVILFQRHDLRDRFINLISAGRMNTATQAVDDAAKRVSRYLGMQLLVNAAYGIPVGIGLAFIGVPGAVLWGLLATVLRFIPFLGPWIAAVLPLTLAAAIDPGWSKLLYAAGLFVVLELISNNLIELVAYRASTGISSFALLVAAVFWTWLWGMAGLFLSTPLTVCLLVIGKYVPGLKFLSVLLGSEPVMTPPMLFYQRMLSMNFDQMHELATKHIAERSVVAFYDDVFIPALILAEEDRHSGALAEVRERFILQGGRELIDELAAHDPISEPPEAPSASGPPPRASILGIPARDEADELVARMLQHVLRLRGVMVEVCPTTASPADHAARLAETGAHAIFISALPPSTLVAARQACRRLKSENRDLHVLVGVWSQEARPVELKSRFRDAKPDEVVTSLSTAASSLEQLAKSDGPSPGLESGSAAPAARKVTSLPIEPALSPAETYDGITRDLAQTFDVPVSMVKIIDSDRDFWNAQPWFVGTADQQTRDALRETTSASSVNAEADLVVVEDIRKDKRFATNPVLRERGVCFYAGVPLSRQDGRVVGILGVIDTKVRAASPIQTQALRLRAVKLMDSMEANRPSSATVASGDTPGRAGMEPAREKLPGPVLKLKEVGEPDLAV